VFEEGRRLEIKFVAVKASSCFSGDVEGNLGSGRKLSGWNLSREEKASGKS